jgi:hypothetical protein
LSVLGDVRQRLDGGQTAAQDAGEDAVRQLAQLVVGLLGLRERPD